MIFTKLKFNFISRYFDVKKWTYDDPNHGKCQLLSHACNLNPRLEFKVLESCPRFPETQRPRGRPRKAKEEEVEENVIEIPYWKLTRF